MKKIANKKFNRQWLADECGITVQYLHSVLVGIKRPSKSMLILMALILETSPDYLNWNSDDPSPKSERAA